MIFFKPKIKDKRILIFNYFYIKKTKYEKV